MSETHGLFFPRGHSPGEEVELEILKELNESTSDRAVAVLAAALVEQRLVEVLRSCLIEDDGALKELLRDGSALTSIGTLSHLGFLMGWFGPNAYADLKEIVVIRNLFAHKTHTDNKGERPKSAISFDSDLIKSKCMNLKIPQIYRRPKDPTKPADSVFAEDEWLPPPASPKDRFVRSATLIHGYLGYRLPYPLRYAYKAQFLTIG